jgi:hypothetical protein
MLMKKISLSNISCLKGGFIKKINKKNNLKNKKKKFNKNEYFSKNPQKIKISFDKFFNFYK